MSSGTSTERREARPDGGFEVWHFYVLLSMIAATAAVMLARDTHPAALLLLSAAVLAAGFVGLTLHRALAGFVGADEGAAPAGDVEREALEREKALTLRSIKELEFDRAMGKISDKDFDDLAGRLRARAMLLMEELDRLTPPPVETGTASVGAADAAEARPAAAEPAPDTAACPSCATLNDPDARFCKQCGARL